MSRCEDKFLLFMIIIMFCVGFFSITKTEQLVSTSENRKLATFEHFTIESFMNGSFQDNFESALSDQFVLSEKIRTGYTRVISNLPTIDVYDSVCKNHYIEVFGSVDRRRATFDCDDYILFYPVALTDEQNDIFYENIDKYSNLNTLTDAYYYFINDSSSYNFETDSKTIDYVSALKSNMKGKYHFDALDLGDYSQYKEYFYKTDHHWNYKGSYKGYLDIAKLLDLQNPLEPLSEGTNHEVFFGSHARNTNNYEYKQEFVYYNFDIPEHDTFINGKADEYGHYEDYVAHNYKYDRSFNYYGYFYGGDYGEVMFDFKQPDRDNLLIISNSYSNAINELIASHFNKTYIIDLRHYKQELGKDFSLSDYLASHGIGKTLIIMSPTFVNQASTNEGLEP